MFRFVSSLFGCTHARCTFPITTRNAGQKRSAPADGSSHTYVVCLDCGKEFPYDWKRMKVVAADKSVPGAVA